MRTRFLDIDYFAPENDSFHRLPVPHLASKPLSTAGDLLHFDFVPEISLGIDKLTIDSALTKFFDDVLPRRIDDDNDFRDACDRSSRLQGSTVRFFSSECVETRFLEEKAKGTNEENLEGDWKNFGSETPEIEFENKDTGTDTRNRNLAYDMIQFETPQLDAFLENTFLFENEEVKILTVLPEVEFAPETLNQGLLKYPSGVKESVYAAEGINSDYLWDQRSCSFEDDFSQDQKQLDQLTFPFLEVDEMVLGTLAFLSLKDELFLILDNTEPQEIQDDNLFVSNEEYLCNMKCDVEEFLSDHILRPCTVSDMVSPDSFGVSELMSLIETSEIPVSSAVQTKSSFDFPVGPASFEEFQLLDIYLDQPFGVFFDLELSVFSEISDCMSIESTNFKNFNELIVCHELALVDGTFKSLPVPILPSQGSERPLLAFIEDLLANLNAQSLSASDDIYLDWYLLEENSCSSGMYSSYQNILEEINLKPIDFDQEPCENDSTFYKYVFSDEALVRETTEDKGELKETFPDGISVPPSQTIVVASSKLLNDRCQQKGRQDHAADGNPQKALSSWKSKPESNDSYFFLNSQKPAGVGISEVFSAVNTNTMLPKVPCDGKLTNKPSMSSTDCSLKQLSSADGSLKQLNVALHQVFLSDNIVHLISNSEKTYLAILQNETELRKTYLPYVADDYSLMLSLPKQKLIDCVEKIYLQGTSTYWEEKIMTLATLYATKQIAWYLCFYGIYPAHLYLKKLCQSLECLKSRLGFLVSLIEEAGTKVDREITLSHPALTTIQDILCSKTSTGTLKVLVVANPIFWWSLKKLLGSLGLSFEELNYESPTDDNATIRVDGLVSNCLLVSHEYVSGSFPFNKFSIILEYGGPNGSSQISTYFSKLIGMPHLHFVKLELDKGGNCEAFCGGVDLPQHNELTIDEKPLVENQTRMLKTLLNFLPVEEKYTLASSAETIEAEDGRVPPGVPAVPVLDKPQHIDLVSFPEAIIIVNTQKFEKEMIVCRRSSYQRILALEKEGVQVVERDMSLPVDLIITSGICLMWYDCTNILRKASTSNEASSCLTLCIENIATDILTSLSLAFRGCVLVFEGEISSLSIVMESSDGLYAAAASLEIDFQLFCSYSSELTDDIILGCIENVSNFTKRRLYPKMSESETLAESFLTSFPSINPLAAHGILSSESILGDFIEWPHERRLQAIRKYCIPDESVSLFSALCKYGEREDTKSVMTDCSSSVSSGPESEMCHFNGNSERKRRNFTGGTQCIDENMEFLNSCRLKQFTADTAETLAASKCFGSQMFGDTEIFCDLKGLSSSVNDLFNQNHNLESFDATISMDPTRAFKPRDSWISPAPEVSDEIRGRCSSFVQNQGLDRNKKKVQNFHNMNKSENQHEELIGEVVNLIDDPALNDPFATMALTNFLPSMFDNEKDSSRESKIQRRLSYGQSDHPFCAVDVGNNSSSDFWSSINLHGQSLRGSDKQFPDPSFEPSIMPFRYKDDRSDEGLVQNPVRDSKLLFSLPQKDISHSDVTPLSIALRAKHVQESSPWTMEFLNRIREKSRNRRNSVPRGSPSPFPENLGNVKKTVKRRSPSILEFFKYQGGSTLKKPDQKRQKQSLQSSNSSKNVLAPTSELSSWTPIDKRSRQTLSFATDGNGSQTKLVWSNDNYGLAKSSQKLCNK